MALRNTNTRVAGSGEMAIQGHLPGAGAHISANSMPEPVPALEFNPLDASPNCQDNGLTCTLAGGAAVTENCYLDSNDDPLPSFVLPDGSTAVAGDVSPDILDISTEAGVNIHQSGGVGEYDDTVGDLLGGLERIGALGTDFWNAEAPREDEIITVQDILNDDGPQEDPGMTPLPATPPPVPDADYNARAVIYAQDPTKTNSVTTRYLNSNGEPVTGEPELTFVDGDGETLVSWSYRPDGSLVFTLTDAGKAFVASEGAPDYMEILYRVTDRITGESYTIQIVVPADRHFDAGNFAGNGSRYAGPVGDDHLIHDEWHEGDSDTLRDYQSTSSNLDDSYVLNGVSKGTDIPTGYGPGNWGNDAVEIRGDIDNAGGTVNIITGTGQDTVSLYAMYARQGGTNLMDTGRELADQVNMIWKMQAEGTHNASDQVSRNTVLTGDMNLASETNHGMYAVNTNQGPNKGGNSGGFNTITAQEGQVDVTVKSGGGDADGLRASGYEAFNTISASGVSLDVYADGGGRACGMRAETNGENAILASQGHALTVVIKVTAGSADDAYAMYTAGNGRNRIQGADKDDLVDITGRLAGNNTIDTGAVNDTISLIGRVDACLEHKAGEGHDLLILKAEDAQSFTENYRPWLLSMSNEQLKDMSIEEIWVNAKEGAEWMHDSGMGWLWDFVDRYNDLTGNDVLPQTYVFFNEEDIGSLAEALCLENNGLHSGCILDGPQDHEPSTDYFVAEPEPAVFSLQGLGSLFSDLLSEIEDPQTLDCLLPADDRPDNLETRAVPSAPLDSENGITQETVVLYLNESAALRSGLMGDDDELEAMLRIQSEIL